LLKKERELSGPSTAFATCAHQFPLFFLDLFKKDLIRIPKSKVCGEKLFCFFVGVNNSFKVVVVKIEHFLNSFLVSSWGFPSLILIIV